MSHSLSRRGLAAAGVLAATPALAAEAPLAALERREGGRLHVFALDTGSGRSLAHRADGRVLMCSTFKALLGAAVLARVDAGQESLDRRVAIRGEDLLAYAPVARAHAGAGRASVAVLAEGMVGLSDNTAANLLLPGVGGPAGLTRWLRGIGDPLTRLDRDEPGLNRPSGEMDTSTPRQMAMTLRRILLGEVLAPASRERLEGWMAASPTGRARLRAGFPPGWPVADKTGTGESWANVIALVRPPGRAPAVVASFYDLANAAGAKRDSVHREVGRIVGEWLG
ncbi:class A beta-lactamase [Roseococcus sp. SYP-B2431]|uniref:class A beta-lactamase n=1 Tax=Roseococcus sp. SYP-B2431 TaxID=2496640 RepID=UPI0010408682|nr:class A beta-lactamase [Roseococcus sp. SYP-B2431]TCH99842.1 class A beta-lactamase [Roseococcus sp. SYP-B2431]